MQLSNIMLTVVLDNLQLLCTIADHGEAVKMFCQILQYYRCHLPEWRKKEIKVRDMDEETIKA